MLGRKKVGESLAYGSIPIDPFVVKIKTSTVFSNFHFAADGEKLSNITYTLLPNFSLPLTVDILLFVNRIRFSLGQTSETSHFFRFPSEPLHRLKAEYLADFQNR